MEIFEYGGDTLSMAHNNSKRAVSAQGIGHLSNGGEMLSEYSEISSHSVTGQGLLKWCYVRDNEGNIIELQQWT